MLAPELLQQAGEPGQPWLCGSFPTVPSKQGFSMSKSRENSSPGCCYEAGTWQSPRPHLLVHGSTNTILLGVLKEKAFAISSTYQSALSDPTACFILKAALHSLSVPLPRWCWICSTVQLCAREAEEGLSSPEKSQISQM